jgi:hypothetical protein
MVMFIVKLDSDDFGAGTEVSCWQTRTEMLNFCPGDERSVPDRKPE